MSALTLFTSWARGNCTRADNRRDAIAYAREAFEEGADCHFVFGPDLIRTRVPYLIHLFGGELFAFALTQQHIAAIGADAAKFGCGNDGPSLPPPQSPLATVESVAFDNAAAFDPYQPVRGTCVCRWRAPPPDPVCLRLDMMFHLQGRKRQGCWNSLHAVRLPFRDADGKMTFEFQPRPQALKARPFLARQPIAAFLRVCKMPSVKTRDVAPLSTPCAALLTLQ